MNYVFSGVSCLVDLFFLDCKFVWFCRLYLDFLYEMYVGFKWIEKNIYLKSLFGFYMDGNCFRIVIWCGFVCKSVEECELVWLIC